MYRSFLLASALATACSANAQSYIHQVMVLNEGYFDMQTGTQVVPVTLGSYNPASGTYQTVATIADARFGNHVLVENGFIYVGADQRLLKYDADTYTLVDEAVVPGIRRFAVWQDALVITLGEVGGLSHYCEVRDKNTFDLLYSIDATVLPYSCEGVQVVNDKAYLAVNNGFDWANLVGKIGVLDLATQSWEASVDLGANGLNPENIMVSGDAIYAFNNKDFTGSSVSRMSIGGLLDYTTDVALSSGCGSSAVVEDRLYFMEYAQNVLNRFDLITGAVLDTLPNSPATYGLIGDPVNGVIYGTTTDFFSSGELHVMDHEGQILSSVAVSVNPGRLALDERSSVGVEEKAIVNMSLYPDPADESLTIGMDAGSNAALVMLDAAGRCVMSIPATANGVRTVLLSGLASGVYTLRSPSGSVGRFMKR
jgi:hypothetical protein